MWFIFNIDSFLNRARLAVRIFHDMLGGGVFDPSPPSNSAPIRCRSEKPKSVFESSSEIILKAFLSFFSLRSISRPPKFKINETSFFGNASLSQKLL